MLPLSSDLDPIMTKEVKNGLSSVRIFLRADNCAAKRTGMYEASSSIISSFHQSEFFDLEGHQTSMGHRMSA
jgi:hypothetical protein